MAGEPAKHVVDHLSRAKGLGATHAVERLRLVQYDGLLRLRREAEARHQPDRILGTSARAEAALDAVALDEAKLRRLGRVEQRGFRAGADARLAERARGLVHGDRTERRAGLKWDHFRRRRRV